MPHNRSYFFSIVLSVYNQEKYLDKAIESLLAQDIGFEENVELVLVNDGSTDRSLERCEHYKELYPDNIVIVNQTNQGLATARNVGMRASSGRFVNFMDPDDAIQQSTLSKVKSFACSEEASNLPILGIPVHFDGNRAGLHPKYRGMPEGSSVIDLSETPDFFVLTAAASFYPREVILNHPFDPNNIAAEDSEVSLAILAENGFRWGYVNEPDANYLYWQHETPTSIIGSTAKLREPAECILRFLERQLEGVEVPHPAIQSAIIYLLRPRLKAVQSDWFTSAEDERSFKLRVRALLERIDPLTLANSTWCDSPAVHYLFSSACFLDRPWKIGRDGDIEERGTAIGRIEDLLVQVRRVNLRPDTLELEVIFLDRFIPDIELVLISPDGKVLQPISSAVTENQFAKKVQHQYVSRVHSLNFVIPVDMNESRWRFAFRTTGSSTTYAAANVKHWGQSPFRSQDATIKVFTAEYWVRYEPNTMGFWIRRAKTNPMMYYARSTFRLWAKNKKGKLFLSRLLASPTKDKILICDRPGFGDDNGEALFRYIQKHRPELREQTWLVLLPSAPSYKELKKTKRVVHPGSLRHKKLYLNCRILFTSHQFDGFTSPWKKRVVPEISDVIDLTFVWLQHGVTMNNVDSAFNRLNRGLDGLSVATTHEESYAKKGELLHTPLSVMPVGFTRFDLLSDSSSSQDQKVILYTPTWRTWLTGAILPSGAHATENGFEESDYFLQQERLLSDPEVIEALDRSGARIDLVLHPGMAAYTSSYQRLASQRVRILEPGSVKYRDIFNSSHAMITDYSSVFFDFVYMGKPVIFDHSDEERFRDSHYRSGVFDYSTSAPGPVARNFEELKRELLELISRNFKMEDRYAARLEGIFLHRDGNNSQRTLDASLEIDRRRRGLTKTP